MLKILYFTFLLLLGVLKSEAINPAKCNSDVSQPQCVVEDYAPHAAWYVYDQKGQKCVLTRWSDEWDSPGNIPNIYSSLKECEDECDWELKARRFG